MLLNSQAMKKIGARRKVFLILLLLLTPATAFARKHETGFLDRTVSLNGESYRYQVYVPRDFDSKKKWPVILFLHGVGERGDDGMQQTNVGIGRAIRADASRFPFIVVMPQCRKDKRWIDAEMQAQALAALEHSIREFHGDRDRLYLTGLSMGGYGTWDMTAKYPGKFAAYVPICGGIYGPPKVPDARVVLAADPNVADPYAEMGGYWGTGASLAMESAPQHSRGFFSGLMQSGYPIGYLLAAVAIKTVLPSFGWRAMFGLGLPVALVISLLALRSPESVAWEENRVGSVRSILLVLWRHRGSFAYLLLLMTVMSCLSHGTQDLYPDFLRSTHGLARNAVSDIAILYNASAIAGALLFGPISERIGRRRSIMLALCVSLAALHPWAFATSVSVLILGACLMQAGVQEAFGVIPAHLNEPSPDETRSLFPGLTYQLGVLIASPAVSIEYALRKRLGYPWALTIFEGAVILSLILIFQLGPERQGRSFRGTHVTGK